MLTYWLICMLVARIHRLGFLVYCFMDFGKQGSRLGCFWSVAYRTPCDPLCLCNSVMKKAELIAVAIADLIVAAFIIVYEITDIKWFVIVGLAMLVVTLIEEIVFIVALSLENYN